MMTEEQLIDRICLTCVDVRHAATEESAQKFINDIRGLAEKLAALTQPVSPALKLPDERVDSGVNGRLYHNEGWNACLAEVKRLNAPHTAPIEPICATGGAEWVKVSNNTPDPNSKVIAYTAYGEMIFDMHYMWSKYDKEWMTEYSLWRGAVTHWMYHPAAPEEE